MRYIIRSIMMIVAWILPLHWIVHHVDVWYGVRWWWLIVAMVILVLIVSCRWKRGILFWWLLLVIRCGAYRHTQSWSMIPEWLVIVRPIMIVISLALWFRTMMTVWLIPLIAAVVWWLMMAVPRQVSTWTAQSLQTHITPVQVYREPTNHDEKVTLFDTAAPHIIRKKHRHTIDTSNLSIDYASKDVQGGQVIVYLDNGTTLHIAPQTSLSLEKNNQTRHVRIESGSLYRSQLRSTLDTHIITQSEIHQTMTGAVWSIDTPDDIYHEKHTEQLRLAFAKHAPSSRTATTVGSVLLQYKLSLLDQLWSHLPQLPKLHQYQCMMYSKRCDRITKNHDRRSWRQFESLSADSALLDTIQRATQDTQKRLQPLQKTIKSIR